MWHVNKCGLSHFHTFQKRAVCSYHPLPFLSCTTCYVGSRWGCSSISPEVTSPSSSFCRPVKWVCKGITSFGRKSLPPEGLCHCKFPFCRLLSCLPPVCTGGRVFGCLVTEVQVPWAWNLLSQSFSASLLLHACCCLLQLSHLQVLRVFLTQEKGFGTGYPTRPSQQDGGHSSEIKVAVPLGGFALSILAVADVSTQTCWRKKLRVRPQTAEAPLTCADGHRIVPSYWGVCTSDVSHFTWTWNVPPSKRFPLVQTAMWTSLADVPHSLPTLVMVLLVSPGVLQGCRSETQPRSLLAPQPDSFSCASCQLLASLGITLAFPWLRLLTLDSHFCCKACLHWS